MLVLNVVLIALAVTIDPIPLTAFILVLSSRRGLQKAAAFTFGWLASLAVVMVVTVVATGNNPPRPNTAPSLAALAVKTLLGTALVWIAVRRRRRIGRPKPPKKPPRWQASVDDMSPWYAMGLAPLLQPWGLIAAGVSTIVEAKLSTGADYVTLFLFALIGSASYLLMDTYAAIRPDQSQVFLIKLRKLIDDNTDQVIIVGSLILGLWLIGSSIYQIVS